MALETPSPLDQKILEHFPGLVVRKDLTTELKQNAVVPASPALDSSGRTS